MVTMSKKYEALGEFLEQQTSDEVSLSFDQITKIISRNLPKSADEYDVWWSNSPVEGRHNAVWLTRGWETTKLNRRARTVKFVRTGLSREIVKHKSVSRGRSVAAQPTTALSPAPVAASNHVLLSFQWMMLGNVVLDHAGGLQFPAVTANAGLYRIRIKLKEQSRFYVGESQSLRRRFSNYRAGHSGQKTSHRIHLLLKESLAAGAQIEVDIVTSDVTLEINGSVVAAEMSNKATRRMIEHAAIVATGGSDIELANL